MNFWQILSLIFGIIMIVVGFYCLFWPGITFAMLGLVIGVVMVMDGITRFFVWSDLKKEGANDSLFLMGGILSLVLGLIIVCSAAAQFMLDVIIAYGIGIWFLIIGIITMIRGFKLRNIHEDHDTVLIGKHWYLSVILGLIVAVVAILALINPSITMIATGILIGLAIIFLGTNLVASSFDGY